VVAQKMAAPSVAVPAMPSSFEGMVALCAEKREAVLAAALTSAVHLVQYEPGRVELRPAPAAPNDLAPRLSRLLGEWTGRPWLISLSREDGAPTLRDQGIEREFQRKRDAANHPLVRAVLTAFPGATIEAVRDLTVDPDEDAVMPSDPVAMVFAESDPVNGDDE
jgi:DNA polymerase-3 subunit gamma/tau